jgi:uncharacterized protein YgiM (DUF1202 family)
MSAYLDEADGVKRAHVRYALKSLTEEDRKAPAAIPAFIFTLALAVAFYFAFPLLLERSTDPTTAGDGTYGAERSAGEAAPTRIVSSDASTGKGVMQAQPEAATAERPDSGMPGRTGSAGTHTAVVTTEAANIRQYPGVRSRSILVVSSGEKIKLTGEVTNINGTSWYRVQLGDGGHGWISSNVFKIIEDA